MPTALEFAQVRRIMDEGRDHEAGCNSDRHVYVEVPAPVEVISDVTADGRAHDRRDHQTQPPDCHRECLLVGRKGFHQDGLGKWLQSSSSNSLEKTKCDHLVESLSRTTQD